MTGQKCDRCRAMPTIRTLGPSTDRRHGVEGKPPAPRNTPNYSFSRGFTLIELIVTVSIIGVLMVLILPALAAARGAGRSVLCASHLRQMGVAIYTTAQAHNDFFPPSFIQPNPQLHWAGLITSDVTGTRIEYDTDGMPLGKNLSIFMCPAAKIPNTGPGTRHNHYSAHKVLMPSRWINSGWSGPKRKLGLVRRASEVIMIADGAQSDQPNDHGNTGNAFPTFRRTTPNPVVFYRPSDPDINDPIAEPANTNQDTTANRGHIRYRHEHDTAATFAFVDGHVKTLKRGQVKYRNIRVNR